MVCTILPLKWAAAQDNTAAKVILIGTGNPGIDPETWGPSTAILVNGSIYLVDMGPGVVRRTKYASIKNTLPSLDPLKFKVVFVTHLHSDHTVGYPDLIFSTWTLGRNYPLEVYGPKGIAGMTKNVIAAYEVDIATRTNPNGNQRTFPTGYAVNAHEISAGIVYKDSNVTVTAFPTKHAMESYGYRFDTKDRSIVITGDTNPTDATVSACTGCDILIHEVISAEQKRSTTFQQFAEKYHTTSYQLAELAKQAKPKLLVLYHFGSANSKDISSEMHSRYNGKFVLGRDADVF
jgi:ribonuclease BN (tRNA processing enzyme)